MSTLRFLQTVSDDAVALGLQSRSQVPRIRQPDKSQGGALVRPAILAVVIVALAACSSSAPPPPSDPTAEAAILKKDCSDPHWRDENLGLWYSVCRPSLRW
jgi:hypothetical protein